MSNLAKHSLLMKKTCQTVRRGENTRQRAPVPVLLPVRLCPGWYSLGGFCFSIGSRFFMPKIKRKLTSLSLN